MELEQIEKMSGAEKRKRISDAIASNPTASDREIARLIQCDHKTVGAVRRELAAETSIQQEEGNPMTQPMKSPKVALTHVEMIERFQSDINTAFDRLLKSMRGETVSSAQHKNGSEPATTLFDGDVVDFPSHLNNEAFHDLWSHHLKDRKTRKFPIDESTQKKQLKILSRFDEEQATEIVGSCIEKKWKGIPVYSELSSTMWSGRRPAFPPEELATSIVPAKQRTAPFDRSQHGKLNTRTVPRRTLQQMKDDMLK